MKSLIFDHKKNEVSKYTTYIAENYFWISYKTLFYVIAEGMKLLWLAEVIKEKYDKHWLKKKVDSSPSKQSDPNEQS